MSVSVCVFVRLLPPSIQISELQHARDGFQMTIGSSQVKRSPVIVVTKVRVHTNHLHRHMLQPGGWGLEAKPGWSKQIQTTSSHPPTLLYDSI